MEEALGRQSVSLLEQRVYVLLLNHAEGELRVDMPLSSVVSAVRCSERRVWAALERLQALEMLDVAPGEAEGAWLLPMGWYRRAVEVIRADEARG